MTEKNFSRTKYNIAWVSIAVIFVGTIVYPIMYEYASSVRISEKNKMLAELMYENQKNKEMLFVQPIATPINQPPPSEEAIDEMKEAEELVQNTQDSKFVFERNIGVGDRGEDVKELQKYLNEHNFIVAQSGPGSPGNETTLFWHSTSEALKKFQEAHAEEILAPYGLSKGTGVLGESTRKFINS